MIHSNLTAFLSNSAGVLSKGPIAVIMAEDQAEVDSTLRHHLHTGFASLLLLTHDQILVADDLAPRIHRISHDTHVENAMVGVMNQLISAAPGVWFYYCFNAEYLFHPFCETRNVRELLAFHTEERREAVLSYVIDLYAGDLEKFPNAVSLKGALLDRSGYYALGRANPDNHNHPRDRQLDFFGGLRWRFEEHIPAGRRKIDRISLFRAKSGLTLRPDFTFDDEEFNTYACPWHNNVTTAIMSFRTAKALKTNPGSMFDIHSFQWHNSTNFQWHSQQLMDLGLMEPGQWF